MSKILSKIGKKKLLERKVGGKKKENRLSPRNRVYHEIFLTLQPSINAYLHNIMAQLNIHGYCITTIAEKASKKVITFYVHYLRHEILVSLTFKQGNQVTCMHSVSCSIQMLTKLTVQKANQNLCRCLLHHQNYGIQNTWTCEGQEFIMWLLMCI